MKLLPFLCLFLTTLSTCTCNEEEEGEEPEKRSLFVLLIDGFRWDYVDLQQGRLKGFDRLLANGVRAEWVQPIFPTISYPSWTTLSTGLYAENHNIVGNYFYDMKLEDVFSLFNTSQTRKEHWWTSIEPIWITATNFRKRAALFQWSRCDVKFDHILPELCEGFETTRGPAGIAKIMNQSVTALENGFDLVMSYIEHVDSIGHQMGPESPLCKEAVRFVDNAIQDFLDALEERELDQKVNIIVVSDHGMKFVGVHSKVHYVPLQSYISPNDIRFVLDRGAMVGISPLVHKKEAVFKQLQKMPGVNVYLKENIPERYHYKNSRLVTDILVVAKDGYFIDPMPGNKQIPYDEGGRMWGGTHGYDPDDPDMRSIFFASGPDFKSNLIHPPIHMVDIYQLYTHLLGVPPKPHNGSWERVDAMLVGSASMCGACWVFVAVCLAALHTVKMLC